MFDALADPLIQLGLFTLLSIFMANPSTHGGWHACSLKSAHGPMVLALGTPLLGLRTRHESHNNRETWMWVSPERLPETSSRMGLFPDPH